MATSRKENGPVPLSQSPDICDRLLAANLKALSPQPTSAAEKGLPAKVPQTIPSQGVK